MLHFRNDDMKYNFMLRNLFYVFFVNFDLTNCEKIAFSLDFRAKMWYTVKQVRDDLNGLRGAAFMRLSSMRPTEEYHEVIILCETQKQ